MSGPFEYGERIDPRNTHPRLLAEHLERYRYAAKTLSGVGRVLDVASGVGYGAPLLLRAGVARVVSVEIDVDAVRIARERAPRGVTVVRADAQRLPLRDATMPGCVALEAVEHMSDPRAFVSEIRRVLAPGGLLVLSTPDRRSELIPHTNPFHTQEFDPDEVVALLAGFRVIRWAGQYVERPGARRTAQRWVVTSPAASTIRSLLPARVRSLFGRAIAGHARVVELPGPQPAATIVVVAQRA